MRAMQIAPVDQLWGKNSMRSGFRLRWIVAGIALLAFAFTGASVAAQDATPVTEFEAEAWPPTIPADTGSIVSVDISCEYAYSDTSYVLVSVTVDAPADMD